MRCNLYLTIFPVILPLASVLAATGPRVCSLPQQKGGNDWIEKRYSAPRHMRKCSLPGNIKPHSRGTLKRADKRACQVGYVMRGMSAANYLTVLHVILPLAHIPEAV